MDLVEKLNPERPFYKVPLGRHNFSVVEIHSLRIQAVSLFLFSFYFRCERIMNGLQDTLNFKD